MKVMDEVVLVMKNLTASATAAAHTFDQAGEFASGITHRGMLIEHLLGHNRHERGVFDAMAGIPPRGEFSSYTGNFRQTNNSFSAATASPQSQRGSSWWGEGAGFNKPPAAWEGTGRAFPSAPMSTEAAAGPLVNRISPAARRCPERTSRRSLSNSRKQKQLAHNRASVSSRRVAPLPMKVESLTVDPSRTTSSMSGQKILPSSRTATMKTRTSRRRKRSRVLRFREKNENPLQLRIA